MDSRLAGLVEAAKAGNPQALTELAHAQAMGAFTPRNLTMALDNLARAASVGWPDALRELQVLARTSGNWKKLRAAVNVEALRRPPPRRVLLEAPRLRGCSMALPRRKNAIGSSHAAATGSAALRSMKGRAEICTVTKGAAIPRRASSSMRPMWC